MKPAILLLLGISLALASPARASDGDGDGGGDGGPDPCLEAGGHYESKPLVPEVLDDSGNPVYHAECVLPPRSSSTQVDTRTEVSENGPAGTKPNSKQTDSFDSAYQNQINESRRQVSTSVLSAAEGVTQLRQSEGSAAAGVLFLHSEDAMTDGEKMRETAVKTLHARDSLAPLGSISTAPAHFQGSLKALHGPVANEIFDEYEAKSPVPRDEFTRKMIDSHGNLEKLEAELKLPPGSIEKAKEAARELTGDEKYAILKNAKVNGLRDSLRARLSKLRPTETTEAPGRPGKSGPKKEPAAALVKDKSPAMDFKNLAADSKNFFASDDNEAELTLFDIVHRKYREKRRFFLSH